MPTADRQAPTARRLLALTCLAAIVALRLEPQLLRFPFIDRGPIGRGLAVYPDRGVEQFPRFLQAVRERTTNGDSIVVVVPMLKWDDGYSYAYYRTSYFLAGREVLPLVTSDDRAHEDNFRTARYIAAWRWNVPPGNRKIVWRGEGGMLLRRE